MLTVARTQDRRVPPRAFSSRPSISHAEGDTPEPSRHSRGYCGNTVVRRHAGLQQPDSARHYAGAALAALTVGAGNASPLTAKAQTLVDSLTP